MRRLLVSAGLLIPALVVPAGAAEADTIRPTTQYQRLKAYVADLERKKDVQQEPTRIDAYRDRLSDRNERARVKVRVLYQRQLRQATQRRETARINARYATQIDELDTELAKLRRRLARAKSALVRETLREQIAATEQEERDLNQERIADINAANNRVDAREEVAREDYAERIEEARTAANADILRLREKLRSLYSRGKSNAQSRRAANFRIVRAKHDEGVGYIDVMPHVGDVVPTL
jgi:chromosome segregation ATPase